MNNLAILAFMPHGMCYLWKPGLLGLHIVSNGIIALAYFSIPLIMIYIQRQRADIPFDGIFLLFAAFILACGLGHAFDIWTLWHANYWVSGYLKLLTALISLATAITIIIKIPEILTLPSSQQMKETNQQLQTKIAELEQQKAIINEQEQFLRSIYDHVQEAIFVIDIDSNHTFRYQGFNPAAQKLTGIQDVVNQTPQQILPLEVALKVEANYQQCLHSKQTIFYEECLPFQGKDTWWLTTLNPIKDDTGKIYRIIGTSLNINERKATEIELDNEKNFLQALLDNLSDGIVACDKQGVLTLFNRATQEFHGLPQEPIPTEAWAEYYDLYLPDGKTLMSAKDIPLYRALNGESVRDVEMMIKPKQGQPRTLLANGDPIINGKGKEIGAIVAMRDITDRRAAEQALAQLNDELEARVRQRTTQLEQVNTLLLTTAKTLEQRNQELDQFAYIASHDLKAPLRAIANLSEWIEEDLEDKLDDDTRHNMDLLRGRVHRLENLINGLLDYSRVGRINTAPQSVNVGEMLAEIIDLLDIPQDCHIEIQSEMPTLITEVIPLQQIFHNLISNAIKYSNKDQIKIKISVQELDDYYQFAVSDNGEGIDPKYHERIFNIFQTLTARDTKESTGIGLAIVKKAVENQGGKIVVESKINEGSTFKFTWKKVQNLGDG